MKKTLSKLSLLALSKAEMEKRELNALRGGTCTCATGCSCKYEGTQSDPTDSCYGGSSTSANSEGNSSKYSDQVANDVAK
jgi:natural product precursor